MGWFSQGEVPLVLSGDEHDPLFDRVRSMGYFNAFMLIVNVTILFCALVAYVVTNIYLSEYSGVERTLFGDDHTYSSFLGTSFFVLFVLSIYIINGIYNLYAISAISGKLRGQDKDDEYWEVRKKCIEKLYNKEESINASIGGTSGCAFALSIMLVVWSLHVISKENILNAAVSEGIFSTVLILSAALFSLGCRMVKDQFGDFGSVLWVSGAMILAMVSAPSLIQLMRFFNAM